MTPHDVPVITMGVALHRALRLRCLACGATPLFTGLFAMHRRCSACGFVYEREPGYFLGSIYFGYGGLALVTMIAAVVMQFVFDWPVLWILGILTGFVLVVSVLGFRHARAAWMALDVVCDPLKAEDFPEAEQP